MRSLASATERCRSPLRPALTRKSGTSTALMKRLQLQARLGRSRYRLIRQRLTPAHLELTKNSSRLHCESRCGSAKLRLHAPNFNPHEVANGSEQALPPRLPHAETNYRRSPKRRRSQIACSICRLSSDGFNDFHWGRLGRHCADSAGHRPCPARHTQVRLYASKHIPGSVTVKR